MNQSNQKIDDVAVFFDFENIVYALRNNYNINANFEDLMDKCKEFGRVVVAHAFADWNRHSASMTTALISNGMDPVYVPTFFMDEGGKQTPRKNAVDMYMAIDAMDVLHNRKSVDTFILLTGDSDFVPLVNAIRREGNRVIAIGVDGTTSSHLAQAVDEFILYSQISNLQTKTSKKRVKDPYEGLVEAVKKLQKQRKSALLPNVKMMMAELMGGFDEKKFSGSNGRRYQKFKEFVQDAEEKSLVKLVTTGTVNEIYLPDQTPKEHDENDVHDRRDRNDRNDRRGGRNGRGRDRNDRQNDRQNDAETENEPVEVINQQGELTLAVALNILVEALDKAKEKDKKARPPAIKSLMKEIYPNFDEKEIIVPDGNSFGRFGEFTAVAVDQGLITISGKGPRQVIALTEKANESAAEDSSTADAGNEVAAEPVTLNGEVPDDLQARVLIIETLRTYPNYPASFLQVESYCRQLRNKQKIELSSTRIRNLMTEVTRNLHLLKRVSKPGKSPSQYKYEGGDEKIAEFLGVPQDSIEAVLQGSYSVEKASEAPADDTADAESAESDQAADTSEENADAEEANAEAQAETTEAEGGTEETEVAAEVATEETEPAQAEAETAEAAPEEPVVEELTITGAYRLLMSAITQNIADEKSLKLRSVKATMIAKNESFDEKNFKNDREKPFKSFIEFTRAAARDGIVELEGKGPKTEVKIVE